MRVKEIKRSEELLNRVTPDQAYDISMTMPTGLESRGREFTTAYSEYNRLMMSLGFSKQEAHELYVINR